MTRSLATAIVLGSLLLPAASASAAALAQRQILLDNTAGVDGLGGPQGAALSPDGKHVYVAGSADHAVAVFARNPTTGTLSFVQPVHVVQQVGAEQIDRLAGAQAAAVSPDGLHVYVVAGTADTLVAFHRDAVTGMLTFLQVVADSEDDVDGLNGAEAVAISPDGANVYVAADNDNAVSVFHRDPVTGMLAFVERKKDGEAPVTGLNKARAVAVSPDGTSVYATGSNDNAVVVFARDAGTGALTWVEEKYNGDGGVVQGLLRARTVGVSPDGANVYVGGGDDNAIAIFGRDGATGMLTYQTVIRDGGTVNGLDGIQALTLTADGTRLYAASSGDDAVAVFARDQVTGDLTFLEALENGENGVTALKDALAVALDAAGRHVYVVASGSHALSVLLTRCGNGTVDADEQCDDGNGKNGDCCSSACQLDAPGTGCTSDRNSCTDDVCDGAGICLHNNNTLPCDDGKFCTVNDTCGSGACQPGAPLDCSAAADQCNDGVCDEKHDRCGKPKANGLACNDSDACTRVDACSAGTCTGTTPVVCLAQDQCHVAGVCDPASGTCSNPTLSDGTGCSDGNACTQSDTCQAGACHSGSPRTCGAADDCHDAGVCDPATGHCSTPLRPDGTSCSDGNACTRTDTCQAGTCIGGAAMTCPPAGPCQLDATCDPASGQCREVPAPDGSACDDGDTCTRGDACQSGACQAGALVDQDDDDVCDARDICPAVFDPAQLDRNTDGTGDACECSASAAARCLTGGGAKNADCLLEFNAVGGTVLGAGGKGKLRCTDGDLACDRDGRADGTCTFGVALCIGNADPRLPQCKPSTMVRLEVMSPNAERSGGTMDRGNALALEQGVATLGVEVRRSGRVITQASSTPETGLCSPQVELHAPAPAGARKKAVRRKVKIRGEAADGRRDVDVLLLECGR